jgi:hypothetical protein
MPTLDDIQRHLEAIYALDTHARVSDFMLDRDGLDRLVTEGLLEPVRAQSDEQVFVLGDEDELSVGVWLSERVRRGLKGPRSLQVHCHATEAVSHFLMLLWTAQEGRTVRLLDLELQAEVDKVATAFLEDLRVGGGAGRQRLLHRLFEGVEFLGHLSPHEEARYREANRLVRRYAVRLAALLERGPDEMISELRHVYRLPAQEKLKHLARAA